MIRRTVLASAAALTALVLAAPAATAQPPIKDRHEEAFFQINTCNGDEVVVEGTLQQVTMYNKTYTAIERINNSFQGTGIGQPSGTEYKLSFHNHVQFDPNDPQKGRFDARLISKGGESNQLTVFVSRDGEFSFETRCVG